VNLGQELFVEPEGRDGYITTDGLRGLADTAMAAGDDGYQYVLAVVEVPPAKRGHWYWGWWRKTRIVRGGLVSASVVVRKPATTTTHSMARAEWRNGGNGHWVAQPEEEPGVTYGRVMPPQQPAWALSSGDYPVHPAEADTTTVDMGALAREAVAPFLAADDALTGQPQVHHYDEEDLPALSGPRRGIVGGRHAAQ